MNAQKLRVVIAGATGWAGSALSKGVHEADDLQLVAAVSRRAAGGDLTRILNLPGGSVPVYATVEEALSVPCDVLVEYTSPESAKGHVLAALQKGVHVVVGTSGLSDDDYHEIEAVATQQGKAVLAVGNFALTVVLLQKFAKMAARYIPNAEIIDYAGAHKVDAPSGTARELAYNLGQVRPSNLGVPLDKVAGPAGVRGARLNETQVHSVRLPGYVISVEAIFGLPDEKLTLRHDAGSSAEPYVAGALLAIRKVGTFTGLKRGLDTVMEF
ncbi:MAG TPA: 4-hydroxy-tetrahydrodipicolinate reductase [Candidatus Sulfotelmatobacter sp.]|nr:4-hydroxy-tetrahydrodipicolinate reductase [Candidatus Sulfotelmatobacter sp.]